MSVNRFNQKYVISSFHFQTCFCACDIYMCVCVVGMSMNAAGMSIHPFQWNFYGLVGKYLHYLIFDDVITLHH